MRRTTRVIGCSTLALLWIVPSCQNDSSPTVQQAGAGGGASGKSNPNSGGTIPQSGVATLGGNSGNTGAGNTETPGGSGQGLSAGGNAGAMTHGAGGQTTGDTRPPIPTKCSIITGTPSAAPAGESEREFAELRRQISAFRGWNVARLKKEAWRADALIQDTDRTPVDIIWRRTLALVEKLKTVPCAPDMAADVAALEALRTTVASSSTAGADAQQALFDKIAKLRRSIAFRNPLLDFDKILFVTHRAPANERHMVDQYHGHNAVAGGSVFVLNNPFLGAAPTVTDLLAKSTVENGRLKGKALTGGSVLSPDLSFDGQTVLFANAECGAGGDWSPQVVYHVFKMNIDGSQLTQLTDGNWNEFDPCWLPDGRIAFISERIGGFGRCHTKPKPTFTVHGMKADGTEIAALSYHETNEWHPSVSNEGTLLYSRWDYVDRDSDVAHHLWTSYPDGRDPRSVHGNYPDKRESRPWMELNIRAVPGSPLYVAVSAPHHGHAFGSLVLIDTRIADDRSTAQVRRLTPEVHFPESESNPGTLLIPGKASGGEVYGTPWPLSEDFYLVSYDPAGKNYGMYLLDSFGNKEFIYRDKAIPCQDPIPLRARPVPPVVTSTLPPAAQSVGKPGTVAIADVYQSEFPLPAGVKIKELRVVSVFAKDTPLADVPNIGAAAQSLARGVLGTAPVEDDGSAFFEMPAGIPVYFQLLDDSGVMVHTMRSDTYVHPGEAMSCTGCHEKKNTAPPTSQGKALLRAPSKLKQEPTGSYPLTFARLMQPVLDSKCATCHQKSGPSLTGVREAFSSLSKYCVARAGGNFTDATRKQKQYSIPGEEGSRASGLYAVITKPHYDVKLTPEEMRRITLWLDTNCNRYGAYIDTEKQDSGGIVLPKWGLPPNVPTADLIR